MKDTLIVFFSHAGENYFAGGLQEIKIGNANKIANMVKIMTGADIFEIETVKKYPNGYKQCCDVALDEQKKGELPALKTKLNNFENYNKFIFVYPCWWGTLPQAFFTFLNEHNFSNKQIYPICTHEGSGMGRSEGDLKKFCKNVSKGLAIVGTDAEESGEEIRNWLKKNNLL